MQDDKGQGEERGGPRTRLVRAFARIALQAGREILAVRASPQVRAKQDNSPVTDADERAEALILEQLAPVCPGIPVVSEEAASRGVTPDASERFLLVDPLDGTREFVAGRDEFTVNIALIENREPVAGVVYLPASRRMWCGALEEDGRRRAWVQLIDSPATTPSAGPETAISTRPFQAGQALALLSYSHRDPQSQPFLGKCGISNVLAIGSSVKFGLIASGEADLYPRFGPTMEWDIAAGDAVLRAAGGITVKTDGAPVLYGNPGFRSPHFLAVGDPRAVAGFLAAAGP